MLVAVQHNRNLLFDDLQTVAHSPYNRSLLRTWRRIMHDILYENNLDGDRSKLESGIGHAVSERD